MTNKPKRRPSGTLAKLTEALGVSKRRVSTLLAEGMPDDVEGALAWRGEREGGDDSTAALRRERIRLIRIDQKRRQFELERAKKEWLPRSIIEEQQTRIGTVMRLALQQAESDLPPRLEGLPADRMSKVLRDYTTRLLEQLADEDSQLWRKAEGE